MNNERISLRVSKDHKKILESQAKNLGVSLSAFLKIVINKYLGEVK